MTGWIRRLLGGDPPEPCDCPCHGDPRIVHIAPCCRACRYCGARFRAGLEAHERACAARPLA